MANCPNCANAYDEGMRDGQHLLDSVAGPAVERAIEKAHADERARWLAALADEYADWPSALSSQMGAGAKDALDNVAERLGLGEEFAALLREGETGANT